MSSFKTAFLLNNKTLTCIILCLLIITYVCCFILHRDNRNVQGLAEMHACVEEERKVIELQMKIEVCNSCKCKIEVSNAYLYF